MDGLLITNARLIDGTGAPPRRPCSIRIRRGRITEIGRELRPSDEPVLDAAGDTCQHLVDVSHHRLQLLLVCLNSFPMRSRNTGYFRLGSFDGSAFSSLVASSGLAANRALARVSMSAEPLVCSSSALASNLSCIPLLLHDRYAVGSPHTE